MDEVDYVTLAMVAGRGAEILGLDLLARRESVEVWRKRQRVLLFFTFLYVVYLVLSVTLHPERINRGDLWLFVIGGLLLAEVSSYTFKRIARVYTDPHPSI